MPGSLPDPLADRAPGAPLRVRPAAEGDRAAWDEHVLLRCGGRLLGTWGWGELRRHLGWEVVRLAAEDAGGLRGVLWLQLRRGPGGVSFAYAPRGPLVASTTDDAPAALALISEAAGIARRRRALLLKLDPEWGVDDPAAGALVSAARLRDSWYDVQHRTTYLVDLEGGAGAVLARIKAGTRRNIRLAERAGVETAVEHDASAVREFHPLLAETGRRQGFSPRDAVYFDTLLASVGQSCPAVVVLARSGGRAISGLIAIAAGPRLVYLYGGNAAGHERVHGAYAAQWAAIRWGIEQGCTVYDMWGVPPHEDPTQPGAGYFEFKTRWNGRIERHIRCQELRLWPAGPLPRLLERIALRGRPLLS
jgi:lipid II:glycine glycyltransferase (peptidoglycan interpeptide bridge formation enzyme)